MDKKDKILEILFNNARHDDLSGVIIVSRINENVFGKIIGEIDQLINSVREETINECIKIAKKYENHKWIIKAISKC